MSEAIMDEIPSSNGLVTTTETNALVKEPSGHNEDEETWLYGKQKGEENVDNTTAPSIDEVTTQEIDAREKAAVPSTTIPITASLIGSQLDDDSDDDDDGIQVTIGNIKAGASIFPPSRQNSRTTIPSGPVIPPKSQATRGIDLDAQGMINGQPTFEHDLMNAYKDDEKPWKKPGADISDYFNYGFTEETWAQYCDRQRRLRAENNLTRLNASHIPQMPPMIPGHPPMGHPMNPHPVMMMNKPPMNMPMMPRPFMNVRKQDGKIDVIGATDQTSRRQMFELQNNFEHPPFMNGSPFPGGQPPNGQTVGDLVTPPPTSNGPPPQHGTPPGANHPIQTLGVHRLPMMPPPPGMQFRPPFGHPHAPGAPPFFPHGPGGAMHGERPPQSYFVPHHPQQQPWEKPNVPPVHGFPPNHFPPQAPAPNNTNNGRPPSSRSPTPEDHSSRSSTPEENRPSGNGGDTEKSSKDDRYKERYRDDRDHYSSSRRRSSPKDRSSSSYRSRHRSGDHEYERPRSDRKSSRDHDDKYERYSRKRHHRDDSGRHHRGDDESSRNHRSSRRTPTKNFSSPPKTLVNNNSENASIESSQTLTENPEIFENDQSSNTVTTTTTANPTVSSSSPVSRSRRDDTERSSSRHSHHKKSSKRSRRDSADERSHHRRSKDKSSSKKTSNQIEMSSDTKEQINE